MGKNSAIKTLGKRIGNIVLHNLLVKHTNRPESRGYLQSEAIEYRNAAIKDAKKYNWNHDDKRELKIAAINFIEQKKAKKYVDVNFSIK
jgi:hypothetical protein